MPKRLVRPAAELLHAIRSADPLEIRPGFRLNLIQEPWSKNAFQNCF